MNIRKQESLEDILKAAYYTPVASDQYLTKANGQFSAFSSPDLLVAFDTIDCFFLKTLNL